MTCANSRVQSKPAHSLQFQEVIFKIYVCTLLTITNCRNEISLNPVVLSYPLLGSGLDSDKSTLVRRILLFIIQLTSFQI